MVPSAFDPFRVSRSADAIAALRARAVADARRLRALANLALRDGLPKADLRARNARAAARSVLGFARRLSEPARLDAGLGADRQAVPAILEPA